ncbi:hypothetical protein [uncultured Shewanella sp.]|uniref:hypothetical protein n=1 Tax=uncultured Shewanella sp. TaxID=173975 RepID=UPI00262E1CAA|nr:hypothetical protein [uncultured Shewanella sp.]
MKYREACLSIFLSADFKTIGLKALSFEALDELEVFGLDWIGLKGFEGIYRTQAEHCYLFGLY